MGCSKTSKKSKTNNNVVPQFGKVIIKGKSDDSEALKRFNIYNFSSLSSRVKEYTNNKKTIDTSFSIVIDSVSSQQFIHILASSPETLYSGQLFINPNDTIVFEIKDKKLKFIGKKCPPK